jgi:hypothetical protein
MGACMSSNVCQSRSSHRNRNSNSNNSNDNNCNPININNQNHNQNNEQNSNVIDSNQNRNTNNNSRNRNNNSRNAYRSPSLSNVTSNFSTTGSSNHQNNNHSSNFSNYYVPTGKNKRLKKDFHKYLKFDLKKMSESQLKAKRDEFWDTAPAFEGKPEIWSALQAAVDSLEAQNFELAQAIIDSANIICPNGLLNDCYDELGNRYQIPAYVLIKPSNLLKKTDKNLKNNNSNKKKQRQEQRKNKSKRKDSSSDDQEEDENDRSSDENTESNAAVENDTEAVNEQISIKVRVSSLTNESSDLKLTVSLNDTVLNLKQKLKTEHNVNLEPSEQRVYFGGRLLKDKDKLKTHKIKRNVVVQVIVRPKAEHSPVVDQNGAKNDILVENLVVSGSYQNNEQANAN